MCLHLNTYYIEHYLWFYISYIRMERLLSCIKHISTGYKPCIFTYVAAACMTKTSILCFAGITSFMIPTEKA